MSGFSEAPLVAGSVFGLRAFKVDEDGTLRGPSFGDYEYRDGENVAKCLRRTHTMNNLGWWMQTTWTQTSCEAVGRKGCTCGFYAYYDGQNTFASGDTISGIIEGYGRATVGDQGFRAEKCKIVALVMPDDKKPKWFHPRWYDKLSDWLIDNEGAGIAGPVAFIVGGFTMVGSLTGLGLAFLPAALTLIALGAIVSKASFHSISRSHPRVSKHELRNCSKIGGLSRSVLSVKYPNVKFYNTVDEMLEAHPVKPVERPKPPADWWHDGIRRDVQARARSGFSSSQNYINFYAQYVEPHQSKPVSDWSGLKHLAKKFEDLNIPSDADEKKDGE